MLAEHLKQGGRCVSLRDGHVVLCTAEAEQQLVKLANIPALGTGQDTQQIENVLAAIGVAWALQVTPELMRAGLETHVDQSSMLNK